MGATFHFDHHAKEALRNRKRFSVTSAFLLMVLLSAVGVIIKQSSYAATYNVTGKVTLNGAAYPGITITTCGTNPSGQTTSTGTYAIGLATQGYCARVSGAKSYYRLTPIYISSEHPATGSYEYQRASINCYRRTTAPCPTTTGINSSYTWDRGVDSATNFAYTYTFPTAPSLTGSSSSSNINLSWTAATTNSGVSSYLVYNNGSLIQTVAGTVRSTSVAYSCGIGYSFKVQTKDSNGVLSAQSNAYAGSVSCPAPPATPPPATPKPVASATPRPVTSTPRPATPKPVAPTPGPVATTVTPAAPNSAPVDTAAPAAPEGFSAAASESGNDIVLSWTPSTDESGIKAYTIERSTNQTDWESVSSDITETTFSDKTVGFDLRYFYRITAADNAGNTSAYAFADITTGSYQANTGTNDAQLASDDGIASVMIPGDAIPNGADCSVVTGDAGVGLMKGQAVIAGPYQILCKDSEGTQIASFTKPLTWTYQFSDQLKGFGDPLAVAVDDSGKAAKAKSTYNIKSKQLSFDQVTGSQTLVLASKKKSIPINLIIGILVVIGIIAAVIFYFLRRGQKQNYSEYIRSKYYDI